jgi:hypothetical protein
MNACASIKVGESPIILLTFGSGSGNLDCTETHKLMAGERLTPNEPLGFAACIAQEGEALRLGGTWPKMSILQPHTGNPVFFAIPLNT